MLSGLIDSAGSYDTHTKKRGGPFTGEFGMDKVFTRGSQ